MRQVVGFPAGQVGAENQAYQASRSDEHRGLQQKGAAENARQLRGGSNGRGVFGMWMVCCPYITVVSVGIDVAPVFLLVSCSSDLQYVIFSSCLDSQASFGAG